jgi:hypothetical protein
MYQVPRQCKVSDCMDLCVTFLILSTNPQLHIHPGNTSWAHTDRFVLGRLVMRHLLEV